MNECVFKSLVFLPHRLILSRGKQTSERELCKKPCVKDCFLCLLSFSYEA